MTIVSSGPPFKIILPDTWRVLLNIENSYFEQKGSKLYPAELQINNANSSDTKAFFLDLNSS